MADWYPRPLNELAAWWQNFNLRRAEFEAKYPILLTYKTELIAAAAWIQYWIGAKNTFRDMETQLSGYFSTIAGKDANADPPAPITWALPPGTPAEVSPGVEKLIRDVRRETVGYTNYAKADGEALGFESVSSAPLNPNEVKPTIQVTAAASNYHFSIVVSGREAATMWDVYILRKGGEWTKVETCNGKSADVQITPTTPGDAEQIQVRVQLRKNNADYGQPSDPTYVTVNP